MCKSNVSDAEYLQMAVYAENAIMGPEGLCTMLFVLGALTQPDRTAHPPTQAERQNSIVLAKTAVSTE